MEWDNVTKYLENKCTYTKVFTVYVTRYWISYHKNENKVDTKNNQDNRILDILRTYRDEQKS